MAIVFAVLGSQVLVYLAGPPSDVARPLWIWAALAGLAALPPRTRHVAKNLALSLVVTSLLLCAADLAMRRLLPDDLYRRAGSGVTYRLPELPELSRYNPGHLSLPRRGDLAVMAGVTIEDSPGYVQELHFDSLGFPNKEEHRDRPIELLLLGDSFGVGGVCTYEDTWARQLEAATGKATYAMAIPGSPWQQLMNLKLTLERLSVRPGATVVWSFFVGNDLEEYHGPSLELPARKSTKAQWKIWLKSLRARSAIRQLLERIEQDRLDAGARAANAAEAQAANATLKAASAPSAPAAPDASAAAPAAPPRPRWWREGDDLAAPVITRKTPDGKPLLFHTPFVRLLDRSVEDVRAHRNWPMLAAVIQEMATFARAQGLRVVATLAPTKAQVYRWCLEGRPPTEAGAPGALATALGVELAKAGIPHRDLAPAFRREAARRVVADGTLLWWRDDTHWGPAGYSLATAEVEALLAEAPR